MIIDPQLMINACGWIKEEEIVYRLTPWMTSRQRLLLVNYRKDLQRQDHWVETAAGRY